MPTSILRFFKLLKTIIFSLLIFQVMAETKHTGKLDEDKIIKMYGYVYDTLSEHPDKIPIKVKIVFESLPHGSEIGIISSNDSSGYYEYYINLKHSYRITIRPEKHRSFNEIIDPNKLLVNQEIKRDYYLDPEIKENQVIRLNKLIFEQGKASITSESFHELNKLANLMIENSSMQIQLEGHTDYRGSKKLNFELSQKRVDAVKTYLIGKEINTRRIKTKAFGGTKPLIKEKSIEASEINRRVEVRILKIE